MGGKQIENFLQTVDTSFRSTNREIFDYLTAHKDQVVADLANSGRVSIPTKNGPVELTLEDLQAAAA